MGLSSSSDNNVSRVLDASVIINLNASGRGAEILKATGYAFIVTDTVLEELHNGAASGRRDAEALERWISIGLLQKLELPQAAEEFFERLVAGDAASTLDDGEAATIAMALAVSGVAVIDEAKANKICAQAFPDLRLSNTVDLLLNEHVDVALGRAIVDDAIFKALRGARMQVPDCYMDVVINRIGQQRASDCHSLPRRRRVVE